MPVRRRYGRRRFPRKAQSGFNWQYHLKKAPQYAQTAMAAWKLASYLKTLVNVEFKKYDVTAALTTDGLVQHISSVPQGDSDLTRDGNSIKCQSLLINAYITNNATEQSTAYRILVVQDKQQIADTAPTIADVLDPTGSNNLIAPLNNETVGRFTVLRDIKGSISNLITGVPAEKFIKIYFKLRNHIRFNGANGSDIQRNGIYIMWTHTAGANYPTMAYTSRLTFTDN